MAMTEKTLLPFCFVFSCNESKSFFSDVQIWFIISFGMRTVMFTFFTCTTQLQSIHTNYLHFSLQKSLHFRILFYE